MGRKNIYLEPGRHVAPVPGGEYDCIELLLPAVREPDPAPGYLLHCSHYLATVFHIKNSVVFTTWPRCSHSGGKVKGEKTETGILAERRLKNPGTWHARSGREAGVTPRAPRRAGGTHRLPRLELSDCPTALCSFGETKKQAWRLALTLILPDLM
jgi:hypothetical protein